jgi:hypothetical protein
LPGTLKLTGLGKVIGANSSAEFVVEMDADVTLTSEYYEVAKKAISFTFDINGTPSGTVTENY